MCGLSLTLCVCVCVRGACCASLQTRSLGPLSLARVPSRAHRKKHLQDHSNGDECVACYLSLISVIRYVRYTGRVRDLLPQSVACAPDFLGP